MWKSFLSASSLCMDTHSLKILPPFKASILGTEALWDADPRARAFLPGSQPPYLSSEIKCGT